MQGICFFFLFRDGQINLSCCRSTGLSCVHTECVCTHAHTQRQTKRLFPRSQSPYFPRSVGKKFVVRIFLFIFSSRPRQNSTLRFRVMRHDHKTLESVCFISPLILICVRLHACSFGAARCGVRAQ